MMNSVGNKAALPESHRAHIPNGTIAAGHDCKHVF